MKKTLLILLILIVSLGLLAGAGLAGYRIGYANAATSTSPDTVRPFQMNTQIMPMNHFGRGFNNHVLTRPGGFNGRGLSYFSPIHFLWNIAILGLVIWFVYWIFTKSGWQVTRKTEAAQKTDSADPTGN
jgi:hypothetical protein